MEHRLRLGRVAGISVAVHWSVVVIVLLLGWGLAAATLPAAAPGYAEVWYWLGGLTAVVVFFAGLLAHELAHSVVARHRGVDVEDITLWLFGGVSRLRGDAATPHDELRIAMAGPVMSFAISAGFGVLAISIATVDGPPLAVATLGWLALINAILGAFNLAPAAPLDGGRVLHAIVWHRTGDRGRATAVATRAGQGFAYVMIWGGVLLLLLGDLAALWFVVLGWFLLNAARAEATHRLLEGALANVRARDIMTAEPIVVPEDLSIDRLVDEWFLREHCSSFPVVDRDGHVRGLVTLQQVRRIDPASRATLCVRDVADPLETVTMCAPDDTMPGLLERLAVTHGGRVLVVDGDSVVGIISPTDVQRALDLAALRQRRESKREREPVPVPERGVHASSSR
jgi:Zn-dependent protease/CBS domain-containing protein